MSATTTTRMTFVTATFSYPKNISRLDLPTGTSNTSFAVNILALALFVVTMLVVAILHVGVLAGATCKMIGAGAYDTTSQA
jgi:hypothetical protein